MEKYYEVRIKKTDCIRVVIESDKATTRDDVEASIANGLMTGRITLNDLSSISSWSEPSITLIDSHPITKDTVDGLKGERTVIRLIHKDS